jgi:DNA mismatch repair protein MutS2
MNEKTLYKLEFHKITQMLSQLAITPMGKEKALALLPSKEADAVLKMQAQTREALAMAVKKTKLPISPIEEITTAIKRVEIGSVLSSKEVLNIGKVLRITREVKNYYKDEKEQEVNYPALEYYFESLTPAPELEREIRRCIVGPDQYADDATPELYQIRRQMKNTHSKIRETLQNILQSSKYKDMLQEPIITQRQDRYCVPVKVEYKSSFPGMVLDQSSTGATVFIEPLSVMELDNQLNLLGVKEQEEIEKLLLYFTGQIEGITQELALNFEQLIKLDVIFAKAEFALKLDAREPRLNTKGLIWLKRARHPLLPKDEVVPIDIGVGDTFTTLLITGPNTGGKTVSLKTMGLFTLMAQSGLQVPAAEGSELAIFDGVYADLGDEQSIEQSLSTFSSHMTNIVSILEQMSTNALVLMDEVGSGTDPIEGAALAMSILEHLRKQQIRTVATTHYSELKLYALSTNGVENASCEFDVASLRPTYKLLMGIPGKSNAFSISMKLGLPLHLIEDAKAYLQKENVKMEDILVELEYNKKIAEIEQQKAKEFRQEAERLKEEVKNQRKKLDQTREKVLERANLKAKELLREVEAETEKTLKEVRQAARAAKVMIDERQLQGAKEAVKETVAKQEKILNKTIGPRKTLKKLPKNLQEGQEVFVKTLMQRGTITKLPDASGNVEVLIGILPMRVHLTQLEAAESAKEEPKKNKPRGGSVGRSVSARPTVKTEVDVRGLMVDEALPIVDKYLDDAYLAGLKQVTIIHGKGTGVLRKAVQTMVKKHPHVKTSRPGLYGEGEMGVTVIEVK